MVSRTQPLPFFAEEPPTLIRCAVCGTEDALPGQAEGYPAGQRFICRLCLSELEQDGPCEDT